MLYLVLCLNWLQRYSEKECVQINLEKILFVKRTWFVLIFAYGPFWCKCGQTIKLHLPVQIIISFCQLHAFWFFPNLFTFKICNPLNVKDISHTGKFMNTTIIFKWKMLNHIWKSLYIHGTSFTNKSKLYTIPAISNLWTLRKQDGDIFVSVNLMHLLSSYSIIRNVQINIKRIYLYYKVDIHESFYRIKGPINKIPILTQA